jgi:hypothetical protein
MSKQFLYAQLNFTHKTNEGAIVTAHQCEVVVEVPKDLIHCEHPESPTGNDEEKIIALEIARVSALGTFPTIDERTAVVHDAGSPIWHEDRPHVMNERACDHEENGIRAWRIAGVSTNGGQCVTTRSG